MTLPNESQHEPSMCRLVTLASIATLRRKVLAPQCIFQSILGICCHIDAAPHEKPTQNIGALETSMHSPYKSALFSAETYHLIEGRLVRFCSLRIGVWPNPRHRGSLFGSSRQYIAGGALGCASLGEPQEPASNDSHPHLSIGQGSTALGKLARKLQNLHRWGS